MIGVFDSGEGGSAAVEEIKRLCPECDIIFLADKENAPYGTKTKSELIRLVKKDIKALRCGGAEKILVACCTASTVYPYLSDEERALCVPIITPTAVEAARLTGGRVGIICTEATARSRCFESALFEINAKIKTTAVPLGELVALVEGGVSDTHYTAKDAARIARLTLPALDFKPDTLILGCTHFSRVSGIIKEILPKVKIVDSAKIGAREILKHATVGSGKMIYV